MLLPNRRRIRTPSPGLPEGSLSPPLSPLHDGLAALHEAATSPERQARALAAAAAAAIPRFHDAPQVSGVVVQISGVGSLGVGGGGGVRVKVTVGGFRENQ